MARITFIGAGSLGFTAGLVRDILTFPLLEDATLALMDINAERLKFAETAVSFPDAVHCRGAAAQASGIDPLLDGKADARAGLLRSRGQAAA